MPKKAKKQENITSQNKDVLFKVLAEKYQDKIFDVFGLNIKLAKIKKMLPTNYPIYSYRNTFR